MSDKGQGRWESSYCFKPIFRLGTDHAQPSAKRQGGGTTIPGSASKEAVAAKTVLCVRCLSGLRPGPGDQCFLNGMIFRCETFARTLPITTPRGEQL